MRVSPPAQSRLGLTLAALLLVVGATLGTLFASWPGALVGLALSLLWTLGASRLARRRFAGRARLVARPLPDAWSTLLRDRYDHYRRLPADLRRRFDDDLRIFIAEQRVTGIGVKVTDELRILVGASAVTLSLGWPGYEWQQLSEILLYPDDFDRDYRIGHAELSGQAHGWGTLILSVPALLEGFDDPDDGSHVGLHEFAHLLDVQGTSFEGLASGFDDAQARRYLELREREIDRVRRGKSVLDEYAASDPLEFFPVAVEAFFETALAVRQHHRELYVLLADYFQQDPAAWDDARGLRL